MDGKIKSKLLELPLLGKIVDPNQYCILRRIEEIRIITKALEKCIVVVLNKLSLNSLI